MHDHDREMHSWMRAITFPRTETLKAIDWAKTWNTSGHRTATTLMHAWPKTIFWIPTEEQLNSYHAPKTNPMPNVFHIKRCSTTKISTLLQVVPTTSSKTFSPPSMQHLKINNLSLTHWTQMWMASSGQWKNEYQLTLRPCIARAQLPF